MVSSGPCPGDGRSPVGLTLAVASSPVPCACRRDMGAQNRDSLGVAADSAAWPGQVPVAMCSAICRPLLPLFLATGPSGLPMSSREGKIPTLVRFLTLAVLDCLVVVVIVPRRSVDSSLHSGTLGDPLLLPGIPWAI